MHVWVQLPSRVLLQPRHFKPGFFLCTVSNLIKDTKEGTVWISYICTSLKKGMAKAVKKITLADEIIVNKIYYIRKQKIMLDRDLAELYGVQAIRLREQVKKKYRKIPIKFYVPVNSKRS
jgi:hypothetical protein